nr:RecName: Full=Heat shock 70 kDa protein [Pinus pinaster]
VEIIANDQGNR